MKVFEYTEAEQKFTETFGRNGWAYNKSMEIWERSDINGIVALQPRTSRNKPQSAMTYIPLRALVEIGEWAKERMAKSEKGE